MGENKVHKIFLILFLLLINNIAYSWGQCGAEGSAISKHIPDAEKIKDGKYGNKYVRWGSACATHDRCYAQKAPQFRNNPTSRSSKKAKKKCDKQFQRNFEKRCSQQLRSKSGVSECFRNAKAYYLAVAVLGKGAWKASMRISPNNYTRKNSSRSILILPKTNISGHQVIIFINKTNKAYIQIDGKKIKMVRNGRFRSTARILSLLPSNIRKNRLLREKILKAKIQWKNGSR